MNSIPRTFTRPLGDDEEVPQITDFVSLKSLYEQNCHNEAALRRILPTLSDRFKLFFMALSQRNVQPTGSTKTSVSEHTAHQHCRILSLAAENSESPDSIELLRQAFEDMGVDPNVCEHNFMSPFNYAVRHCGRDAIVCYLEHGADPNRSKSHSPSIFLSFVAFSEAREDEDLFHTFLLHGANIHDHYYDRNLFQMCYYRNRSLYAAMAFTLGIEDTRYFGDRYDKLPTGLPSFLMKVNNEVNRREENMEHRFLRTFLQQNSDIPFFEDLKRPHAPNTPELAALVTSLLSA